MKKIYLGVVLVMLACAFPYMEAMWRRGLQSLGEYAPAAKEAAKRYFSEEASSLKQGADALKQEATALEGQANALRQEANVARQQATLMEGAAADAAAAARTGATEAGRTGLNLLQQQQSAAVGRATEAMNAGKQNILQNVQQQKTMFGRMAEEQATGLGEIAKMRLKDQIQKLEMDVAEVGKGGEKIAARIKSLRAQQESASQEVKATLEKEIAEQQDLLVGYSERYLQQIDKLKNLKQQLMQ